MLEGDTRNYEIKKTAYGWELRRGLCAISYSYLRDTGGIAGLLDDVERMITKDA